MQLAELHGEEREGALDFAIGRLAGSIGAARATEYDQIVDAHKWGNITSLARVRISP